MKTVIIDGSQFNTIREVHEYLSQELDVGPYYGHNLDALWDRLTTDVEPPVTIHWKNTALSAQKLGYDYTRFIN